ncbi:uncharacterized protein METZ01_LOCUS40486 [marine metagenome]|uniref:Uncharacterized protein n=1 Tax=marine metagenome TaxID=408172 RepID=A0A381R7I4_9ZZZZ
MHDFLNIFQNFSTYCSSLLLLNNNHLTPKSEDRLPRNIQKLLILKQKTDACPEQ